MYENVLQNSVIIIFISTSNRYPTTVRVSEQKPMTIREYTWCFRFPPRCSKYKVKYRTVYKIEVSAPSLNRKYCQQSLLPRKKAFFFPPGSKRNLEISDHQHAVILAKRTGIHSRLSCTTNSKFSEVMVRLPSTECCGFSILVIIKQVIEPKIR